MEIWLYTAGRGDDRGKKTMDSNQRDIIESGKKAMDSSRGDDRGKKNYGQQVQEITESGKQAMDSR